MPSHQRGTGWTNLQTWLGLNQGAAQRMGEGVAGEVDKYAGDYQGAVGRAMNGLRGELGDAALQDPSRVGPLSSAQAQEYAGQEWTGPDGLSADAVGNLTNLAARAQNAAAATDTNSGRATLLQQKYGANSWGGSQLDAALAGAGGGAGRMAQARGAYGKLAESLGGTVQGAKEMATGARGAFEQRRSTYAGMVPGLQQQEAAAQQKAHVAASTQSARDDIKGRRPGDYYRDNKSGRARPGYNYP